MHKTLFALLTARAFAYQAVLTDIEGTTTSISFVHDVLFPYAKTHAQAFLEKNWDRPAVQGIVEEVKAMASLPDAGFDEVLKTLLRWTEEDRKYTPLKALQGMMWKEGYEQKEYTGHIYPEVYDRLSEWKKDGLSLYVYSSGSVTAQHLLFGHTAFGDMTPLFAGYFDTTIGGKKEPLSYAAIAKALKLLPEEILFLSDSLDELNAAKAAGMGTILLCRNGAIPQECPYPAAIDFSEIHPR